MPSLIFLIPVLSSTMVPVARVVIETFLKDADFLAENTLLETTLLLLARDAADTEKTEEAIFIICAMCVSKRVTNYCSNKYM